MKYAVRPLLLSVLAVAALSCDKATPTAPSGSILTISANPALVTSANGTSTITVTGRRSNGGPLADGTEIRLSTNLGTIENFVTLDRNGQATATLRGDGRVGKATVTASAGTTSGGSGGSGGAGGSGGSGGGGGSTSGLLTASIEVEIGTSAKTITLQATPTTIKGNDPVPVTLLALIRDSRGQALAGADVNFTTELGRLASRGAIVKTNSQGEARDTLTFSATDLANNPASVKVTAQAAGSDGALSSATFDVRVQSDLPTAAFTCQKGSSDSEVVFTNTTTGPGLATYTYTWDFGDNLGSNERDPRHTYSANRSYTVQLTVRDPSTSLTDSAVGNITVPVSGACAGS